MLNNIKGFFNIVPVLKQVFIRFPVSFIFILLLTLFSLLLAHKIEIVDKNYIGYVYLILGFSAIAHVSFRLLVESHQWNGRKYAIGGVLLTLVVVFYAIVIHRNAASSAIPFFVLALGLSWLFAPYIARTSNEDSVWYFNYQTGVAIFFAGIAAIVFGGGVSLLLASIDYLFEIKVDSILYADIWIITWGVLFTSYVLANISTTYDYEGESCAFPRGISFIANYILVPLMFAYIAVLYAYFFKILLQWQLPKGHLVWMISAFGVIGVATKLIVYPITRNGSRLMLLFDRYFYYALIIPVIVLFVAIYIRINEYGVTEQRYAVVLLAVLFTAIIALSIFRKASFHIKHIPMILALLALFASYGPWSAVDVSFNSQMQRFQTLLTKYKRYVDGKVVSAKQEVSFEDRKTLSSIADYLVRNKWRKKQLLPLFEQLLAEYDSKEKNIKSSSGRNLLSLANIEYAGYWQRRDNSKKKQFNYRNHTRFNSSMLDVAGYDYVGRQEFYLYSKDYATHNLHIKNKNGDKKITSEFDTNFLKISIGNDYEFSFDLDELLNTLRKKKVKTISKENAHYMVISRTSKDGKLRLKIIIEQINGHVTEPATNKCNSLKYVLMLDFKK